MAFDNLDVFRKKVQANEFKIDEYTRKVNHLSEKVRKNVSAMGANDLLALETLAQEQGNLGIRLHRERDELLHYISIQSKFRGEADSLGARVEALEKSLHRIEKLKEVILGIERFISSPELLCCMMELAGRNATAPGTPRHVVLFCAADPSDAGRIRYGQEYREIDNHLKRSRQRDQFHLVSQLSVMPVDLTASMDHHHADILHFSGHGSHGGQLLFEGGDGTSRPVDPVVLANLLKEYMPNPRCIVLNVCHSADAARILHDHLKCIAIGMEGAIGDLTAIEFSVGFYQGLGEGVSFSRAFERGRNLVSTFDLQSQHMPVIAM